MASRTEHSKPSRELPTTPETTETAGAHRTPAHIHRVRAGQISRGVTTPVPRVYLSVTLTEPGPSGSPEPTRLCRGCSHLPRRSPDRLPPASPHRHDGRAPKVSHLRPTQPRLVAHAAISHLPTGARTGPADGPHGLHQGRRAPRTAARGRRAPPHEPETPPGLGGSGHLRRPRPAAAPSATSPSPGHPRHDPALASPPRSQEVDLPKSSKSPTDRRRPCHAGAADGAGESELGVPQGARRTTQARPSRRRLDDPPDPQGHGIPPAPVRHTDISWRSFAPRPPACSRSTSSTSTAR